MENDVACFPSKGMLRCKYLKVKIKVLRAFSAYKVSSGVDLAFYWLDRLPEKIRFDVALQTRSNMIP